MPACELVAAVRATDGWLEVDRHDMNVRAFVPKVLGDESAMQSPNSSVGMPHSKEGRPEVPGYDILSAVGNGCMTTVY